MKLNNSKTFVICIVTLLAMGGLMLGGLKVLGVPFGKQERTPPPAPEVSNAVMSQFKQSPAWVSLNKALSEAPAGWEAKGEILDSPQAPYPFSCSNEGINPAVSASRLFSADGQQVQVVTTAYTAGLGVLGMTQRFDGIGTCEGGGVSTNTIGGIGEETYQVDVNKSDSRTKDIIFRDGDIVTYVIAEPGNGRAFDQAKKFRDHLMKSVGDQCLATEVSDTDPNRNPYNGGAFTGLLKDRSVEIEAFPVPKDGRIIKLNENGTRATDQSQKPVKVEKVYPLDPEPVTVPDVERPERPGDYPLWPELPAELTKPVEPESPGAQAVEKRNIKERIADEDGPGCGWAFTGSVAPVFDAAKAQVDAANKETQTKSELRQEAQAWQKSVLEYWNQYHSFRKDLSKWNDYSKKVDQTAVSWDKIRQSWDTYYANKENYDQAVVDRNNFIAAKKAAADNYPKQIQQCRVQAEREAEEAAQAAREERERLRREAEARRNNPEPRPEPSSSPSASSAPSASPSAPERVETRDDERPSGGAASSKPSVSAQDNEDDGLSCPAVRPAILDQDPPSVPEAPTPPADPRPADKRD